MSRVGLYLAVDDAQLARLRDGAPDCTFEALSPDQPCDCPVVFGNPDPRVVQANPALRWLQLASVGFGEYADLDWERAHGPVTVSNLAGFFADPVAQSALAGILALYRGIERLILLRDNRAWIGDAVRPTLRLLTGAEVVLFGHGAINRRLAELLAPFRCRITAFDSQWDAASLDAALATANVVVSNVPDTPRTRGVFDEGRLARIKPGAVFCNLGRGSVLDEAALAGALAAGHLAGALIDVTLAEPLPPDHAFWHSPNLILTQHSGGGTTDETDRKITVFLENVARHDSGLAPVGTVDFTRGY